MNNPVHESGVNAGPAGAVTREDDETTTSSLSDGRLRCPSSEGVAGKSGTFHGGKGQRNGLQRLEAITGAVAVRDEFMERVKLAEGDAIRLSDLMAEAIAMDRASRSLEMVGKDGRVTFCMERLSACHAMDAAREAYLKARGSNQPASSTDQGSPATNPPSNEEAVVRK